MNTIDTTTTTEGDLPVPERLHEWTRARPEITHAVLLRGQGPVIDNERLLRDDVLAELNNAARSGDWTSVVFPSRARLADVVFRLVGVHEPATMVWDATVESLELDEALKAIGMTLTFHPTRAYRGPGERSYCKGHVVVPYTVTTPPWMEPLGSAYLTVASEEEGRRHILRKVRAHIASALRDRARRIDDLSKQIEKARGEAFAIVDALSLIDRAPERV